MSYRYFFTVFLILVSLCLGTHTFAAPLQGFTHNPGNMTPAEAKAKLKDALNGQSVRSWVSVDFTKLPSSGTFDGIRKLKAQGFITVAVVTYASCDTKACPIPSPESVYAWYKRAMEVGADAVDYWETWNEPDLRHYWPGTLKQWYTNVHVPASKAIREANEKVVGGSISETPSQVKELIDLGFLQTSDYIAFHPYAYTAEEHIRRVKEVKAMIGNKGMFLTEWNVKSPNMTTWLKDFPKAYEGIKDYVAGVWFYRSIQLPDNDSATAKNFSAYLLNGEPNTPVFNTLKTVFGGTGTIPSIPGGSGNTGGTGGNTGGGNNTGGSGGSVTITPGGSGSSGGTGGTGGSGSTGNTGGTGNTGATGGGITPGGTFGSPYEQFDNYIKQQQAAGATTKGPNGETLYKDPETGEWVTYTELSVRMITRLQAQQPIRSTTTRPTPTPEPQVDPASITPVPQAGSFNLVTCGSVIDASGKRVEKSCRLVDLIEMFSRLINVAFFLMVLVILYKIMMAGWKYVTGKGNPSILNEAKASFTRLFIGLGLMLGAWLLFYFATELLLDPNVIKNPLILDSEQSGTVELGE